MVSVLDEVIAVADADNVFEFIVRLSELLVLPVSATVIWISGLSKVPVIVPVRLFCELPKAKVGAVVPPIEAAVPVIALVPEIPVAIAVNKLLLLATVLSLVVPVTVRTSTFDVVAVTLPVFVWLSICA